MLILLTFQGKNSSDEEDLNDVPDDDEYDTEDSFIDDAELVSSIDNLSCVLYLIVVTDQHQLIVLGRTFQFTKIYLFRSLPPILSVPFIIL